jgi:DNA-binding beta-propeller fold protein YncE
MKTRSYCLLRARKLPLLVFLPILVLGLASCLPLSALSYSEPTPVFTSHVVQEANGLTQLWSRSDVYILSRDKTLDVSMGIGCFIGDLDKALKYDQLSCFESKTGQILWKKEQSATHGLLAVTPTGIYVTDITNISGANTLSRYDLQSGNLVWQKQWYESNPTDLLFFNNQIQLVTWKPGQKLWVFDTDGNILKIIDDTDAFLTTPDVTYSSESGIRALRTDTNDVLWDHVDTGLALTPIITDEKFFCLSVNNSGMAYALDRKTGKLLWQVRDIVYGSSLAYSPEKQLVYALRNNGDLLVIDEDTGETNIAVKFSSPLFSPIIDGAAQAYALAYDKEQHILLVSLGDGHQLFAFGEK